MRVAVVGVELYVASEDGDGVVVLLLVVEEDVAGGLEGVLGDEVLLEIGRVRCEGCGAGVDDVLGEAEGRRVVGVVVDPVEGGVVAAERVVDECGSDGEAVLAVGEDDDSAAVVEIDRDEGLVAWVVSPVPEVFAGRGLLDAPAESPEDLFGESVGCRAIGAVATNGIDGDLRSFLSGERLRA